MLYFMTIKIKILIIITMILCCMVPPVTAWDMQQLNYLDEIGVNESAYNASAYDAIGRGTEGWTQEMGEGHKFVRVCQKSIAICVLCGVICCI